MNKKAMADIGTTLWLSYAEMFFVILIFVGFAVSITIENAFLNYLVIIATGLMVGRRIYHKKGKQTFFPFFLITSGFLLGYMISAAFTNNSSPKMIFVLFILATILSYYIHKKGYIK